MRVVDGELLIGPGDLTGFAACEHLTRLDLAAARGDGARPSARDPLFDLFVRMGRAHEASVVAAYRERLDVVVIPHDGRGLAGLRAAADATEAAMRDGAAVIHGATFLHDGRVSHTDFLERVDTPSDLGAWSYEAGDAKLARAVRRSAVVQLCEHSEHVGRVQGRLPELLHVFTGDGRRHSRRLEDEWPRYRALRERFAAALAAPRDDTYPERVGHCSRCRWSVRCAEQRRADDHLALVADIRSEQIELLRAAGIGTRGALAGAPVGTSVDGIAPDAFERLRHQAELQVRGEGSPRPVHELVERPAFDALPSPSPGDVFLDLEGATHGLDGRGLEYLFGIVVLEDGRPEYHGFWAHDRDEERVAFEHAIDLVTERLAAFPDAHVYHYASYEQVACRRLAAAHDTRRSEVATLLESRAFVDLYEVVRATVRLSTESYSLKKIEQLYRERSDGAVMDAGSSIVAYERYLATADRAILDDLARYNADDCMSLVGLRDWLDARRSEAADREPPVTPAALPT